MLVNLTPVFLDFSEFSNFQTVSKIIYFTQNKVFTSIDNFMITFNYCFLCTYYVVIII